MHLLAMLAIGSLWHKVLRRPAAGLTYLERQSLATNAGWVGDGGSKRWFSPLLAYSALYLKQSSIVCPVDSNGRFVKSAGETR